MTRGRKPKPTHLKLVTGNPGRRKLNEREPKPELLRPMPPEHLSDEAKVEWGRVIDELFAIGLVTKLDRAALAAYCQAYGRWAQAEKALAAADLVVETSNGNAVQNVLVGIANKAMADMVRYAAEFGMTPSARSRIEATPKEPAKGRKDDPAQFFG